MADPLKQFTALAQARNEARAASSAAKVMAEHCDARISELTRTIEPAEAEQARLDMIHCGARFALQNFLDVRKEKAIRAANIAMETPVETTPDT